jgi:hypothetical protein
VLWGCRIFQVRKMGLGEDSVYLYFYFTWCSPVKKEVNGWVKVFFLCSPFQ